MDFPSASIPFLLGALGSALLGSVFAAADAAMATLPPIRLAALHDQSTPANRTHLSRFIANPSAVLSRWLVARVLLTALTAVLVGEALDSRIGRLRPVVAVFGTFLLYGTLAELATIAARVRAPRLGPVLLRLLRPFEIVMIPFAAPLSGLGRQVSTWARSEPSEQSARLAEYEMEHLVEDAQKAGEIAAEPAEMIRNVLDFKDLTVREVMVPRIKLAALEGSTPLDVVLRTVAGEGHSRYPVYRSRIDNIVGLLYTKDLFRMLQKGQFEKKQLLDIVRTPINFVSETQSVLAVLRDMRSRQQHMAVVVDEFGGVSGIVTMEDILEQIVGDIRDEYDGEEAPIQDLGDGHLLADASVSLTDLSAYLGTEIQTDGDYGSLGGLLTKEAGRVPSIGDSMVLSGIEFIVRDGDAKRVIKVEIILPPPPPSSSSRGGSGSSPPSRGGSGSSAFGPPLFEHFVSSRIGVTERYELPYQTLWPNLPLPSSLTFRQSRVLSRYLMAIGPPMAVAPSPC